MLFARSLGGTGSHDAFPSWLRVPHFGPWRADDTPGDTAWFYSEPGRCAHEQRPPRGRVGHDPRRGNNRLFPCDYPLPLTYPVAKWRVGIGCRLPAFTGETHLLPEEFRSGSHYRSGPWQDMMRPVGAEKPDCENPCPLP